jgi:hypothetical protein
MNNEELISFMVPTNCSKYYVATLSNNKEVFQDERKDGPHSWIRLKQFLQLNPDLKIVDLRLIEGNKSFDMPKLQKGYCFGKKMVKIFMGNVEVKGTCVGYYDGDNATLFWISDDGEMVGKEIRDKNKCGFFLIEN